MTAYKLEFSYNVSVWCLLFGGSGGGGGVADGGAGGAEFSRGKDWSEIACDGGGAAYRIALVRFI